MKDILSRFIALAQRFPKLSALLIGGASAFGFQPFGLWPVTLVALALLMALVASAPRGWRAFGIGWAFGVGHFAVSLNWIATAFTFQTEISPWLGWVAVLLLALYLAVYPALAAYGAWRVSKRVAPAPTIVAPAQAGAAVECAPTGDQGSTLPAAPAFAGATASFILAFASLWIVTEWLRSWVFTGFAWNPLGAIVTGWPASAAMWLGTYGLGGLLLLAAGSLLLLSGRKWSAGLNILFALAVVSGSAAFLKAREGGIAAVYAAASSVPRVPITVVQPNVGQQDKWEGAYADVNFAKLADNTGRAKAAPPRLILWPEAAIPDYLEVGYPPVYYDRSPAEARGRLTSLMRPGDLMLLGALKLELDPRGEVIGARNAVMTIDARGNLGPRYDKAHLVPYGEYLPMRGILERIGLSRLAPGDIDFWPGPGPRTIDLGRFGKAGVQICYEIIFSGQVADRANRPDFIFNPSNDAWFGSWGPPQHLAQARMRAIEEGLPVIRATPTGISAVIDADGRIVKSLSMGVAGRIDTNLPPARAPTLFARYGNALPLLLAAVLMLLAIANRRARR